MSPEGGVYEPGTEIILTPIPRDDNQFSSWSGASQGDLVTSSDETWTITMDASKSLNALFIPEEQNDFWVMVYHPAYQWYSMEAEIPWDHLTHLILGYMLLENNSESGWTIKVPDDFYYGQEGWFAKVAEWQPQAQEKGVKMTCMLGGIEVTIYSQQQQMGLLFYETPRSMVEKASFVSEKEMRGLMFWTLRMMEDRNNTFPNLVAIKP